jgi:hypothetical protein
VKEISNTNPKSSIRCENSPKELGSMERLGQSCTVTSLITSLGWNRTYQTWSQSYASPRDEGS